VFGHLPSLDDTASAGQPLNVCMGKEWHRFPSSFFLPDNKRWILQFVQSEFKGQLPHHFLAGQDATRVVRPDFNDLNKGDTNRYVDSAQCHYIVDSDYPQFSEQDRPYSKMKDIWEVMYTTRFLDANNSPTWLRAFYVPFLSERYCSYVGYNLLRNKRLYQMNLQILNP
jgi:alpha-1,2-mannosyltransferase